MAKLTVSLGEGKSTWIKAKPEQASTLLPHQLIRVPHGQSIAVDERTIVEDKGGHFKIELRLTVVPQSGDFKGQEVKWTTGYIYGSHWQGLSNAFKQKQAIATPYSPSGSPITLQPTPYFAQNDNKDWADDGSASNLRYGGVQCGLTSAAMVLATIWPNAKVKELAKQAEGGQFENWVAGQFKKIGAASTSMEGHVAVFKHLGVKATARRDATIGELKQALSTHPAIVAMAYSVSGHFTCGCGLADKPGDLPEKWMIGRVDQWLAYPQDADNSGVIINCPYGKRDFSGSGNNWINIARKAEDAYGLHDVLTNSILERFWVDGGEESGWCVLLDPSTPNVGNAPEKPVELKASTSAEIKALETTWLKPEPKQLSELDQSKCTKIASGTAIANVKALATRNGHTQLDLGGKIVWAFSKHWQIPSSIVPAQSMAPPAQAPRSADFIDRKKLRAAIGELANPNVPDTELDQFVEAFMTEAPKFTITKKSHAIHFLAQCMHESGGLLYLEEIASGEDYEGREDLGNTQPGDGRRFKGRGLTQLTGRLNYTEFKKFTGIDVITDPEQLERYPLALSSALYFWASRNPTLSDDVDKGGMDDATVTAITKVVNGGTNGLADRLHYFHELCEML